MNKSFLGVFLVFIAVMMAVVYFGTKKSGFRGEAIGGGTGGSAYSGAAADLEPGDY